MSNEAINDEMNQEVVAAEETLVTEENDLLKEANEKAIAALEKKATELYEQCKDFMRTINNAPRGITEYDKNNIINDTTLSPINAFILSYERDHNMTVKRKVVMTESATFVVEGPNEEAINDFVSNNSISQIEERVGIEIKREYSEMTEECDSKDEPLVVIANYLND